MKTTENKRFEIIKKIIQLSGNEWIALLIQTIGLCVSMYFIPHWTALFVGWLLGSWISIEIQGIQIQDPPNESKFVKSPFNKDSR